MLEEGVVNFFRLPAAHTANSFERFLVHQRTLTLSVGGHQRSYVSDHRSLLAFLFVLLGPVKVG